MKVYVDELPKSCSYCPCKCFETDTCQLNKGIKCPLENKIANKCPLQSLAYHTKQVRKEVVEFIDKCFEMQKYESIWINPDKTEFSCDIGYAYEWWEGFRKILLNQTQEK